MRTIVRTATTPWSEKIGHDQTWTVAQQLQRPAVGRAGDAAVEVVDDLLGQMSQAQRLAAAIDDDAGRGPGEGVGIATDQAFGQAVEDRVSMMRPPPGSALLPTGRRRCDQSAMDVVTARLSRS